MKIEACIGDISSVLEQTRYSIVGHRSAVDGAKEHVNSDTSGREELPSRPPQLKSQPGSRPAMYEYPQLYDRIHLSNIPDYIGGTLTTFLDALPVLHTGNLFYVTANCLRNPPRFKSVAHFNNEYIALSSPAGLEKAFHVRMAPYNPDPRHPAPVAEYLKWHRYQQSKTLSDRMSRSDIETWLYRLFLAISIPARRQMQHESLIYSPTNLTIFVRLCCHLRDVGYPAHWIGGVLASILSGEITTRARPPRSVPLKIREVKTETSLISQSTRPFVAELSSLLRIWEPVLPFGIPSANIPPPGTVRRYSFTVKKIPHWPTAEPPVFVLVFLKLSLFKKMDVCLRPYLLSDEEGDSSELAQDVRGSGMHVVTTWTWDRENQRGDLWLRQDVVDGMRQDDWRFAIWRSDAWVDQTGQTPLSMLQDCDSF